MVAILIFLYEKGELYNQISISAIIPFLSCDLPVTCKLKTY